MSSLSKSFEDLRLQDLPPQLVTKKDTIYYQGVHIQISMMDALRSLKYALTVNEKENHYLNTQI